MREQEFKRACMGVFLCAEFKNGVSFFIDVTLAEILGLEWPRMDQKPVLEQITWKRQPILQNKRHIRTRGVRLPPEKLFLSHFSKICN